MPIDYSDYPPDWHLRSRFIREYRARGKCEWCGIVNHSIRPDTGARVVLTVAHVFDPTHSNARLLNLAALCQKCHLGHDLDHHLEKRTGRKYHRQKTGLWTKKNRSR